MKNINTQDYTYTLIYDRVEEYKVEIYKREAKVSSIKEELYSRSRHSEGILS